MGFRKNVGLHKRSAGGAADAQEGAQAPRCAAKPEVSVIRFTCMCTDWGRLIIASCFFASTICFRLADHSCLNFKCIFRKPPPPWSFSWFDSQPDDGLHALRTRL